MPGGQGPQPTCSWIKASKSDKSKWGGGFVNVFKEKTERKLSLHELCADYLKLAQASVSIVQFEGVTMCGLGVMGDIVHWGVGKLWAGLDR